VKQLYNHESGQYIQPKGMDVDMFQEIVSELIADKEDVRHKRAHQGDKGSAGLRRVTIRTTNPWGQGGEEGFHGRFVSMFGLCS
jgi:hypothetical protein